MKATKTRRHGNPDPVVLADIVVRIVEAAELEKIGPLKRGQVKYSPSATFSFSLFPRWGRNNKTKEKSLFLCEEIKGGF